MFKIFGAITFGLLAVCGVSYLVLKQQEDKTMAHQIDCWAFNLKTSMKKQAADITGRMKSVLDRFDNPLGPVLVSDEPAA
jgi:hypothetical protein